MSIDKPYGPTIEPILDAWQLYFEDVADWRQVVDGIDPKEGGCGLVYEVPNPLAGRTSESLAIADMSAIAHTTPHYHGNGEVEIYIGLDGAGRIMIGEGAFPIEPGTAVVTLSGIAHYAIPDRRAGGLVLAVINTPPFNPDNCVDLDPAKSNPEVQFNAEQFAKLTKEAGNT